MTLSLAREIQAAGLAGKTSGFYSAFGAIAGLVAAINSGKAFWKSFITI